MAEDGMFIHLLLFKLIFELQYRKLNLHSRYREGIVREDEGTQEVWWKGRYWLSVLDLLH